MSKNATIIIASPEDMTEKMAELVKVLHNLRYWTKYWRLVYGKKAREQKEHWEKRADELLDELGLSGHADTTFRMVPRIQVQNQ